MLATLKSKLLVPVIALALAGAAASARAADDKKAAPPAADTKAKEKKGAEKLEIAITEKGFEPTTVEVKKGQPVELVFTRKTDKTCIKEVILDTGSTKIQKPLPLNTPVAIKAKFAKPGAYVCTMNMFTGTVKVQ